MYETVNKNTIYCIEKKFDKNLKKYYIKNSMKNYKDIIEFFKSLPGLDVAQLNTLTTDFQGAIIYFKSCPLTLAIVYKDKILCNIITLNDEIISNHDIYTYDDIDLLDKLRANYEQSLYNVKRRQLKFKIESLNSDFNIENTVE